jgi:hypothetical protein
MPCARPHRGCTSLAEAEGHAEHTRRFAARKAKRAKSSEARWQSANSTPHRPLQQVEDQDVEVGRRLTTLIGLPAAKALIWSKTSANCSSHSSWVT